ncbi:MAG: hypothetical protein JSS81_27290 [Acidobacteria bacterium]|nr:hypothetical protein [Acidobacteriota bacterium]
MNGPNNFDLQFETFPVFLDEDQIIRAFSERPVIRAGAFALNGFSSQAVRYRQRAPEVGQSGVWPAGEAERRGDVDADAAVFREIDEFGRKGLPKTTVRRDRKRPEREGIRPREAFPRLFEPVVGQHDLFDGLFVDRGKKTVERRIEFGGNLRSDLWSLIFLKDYRNAAGRIDQYSER